MRAVELVVEPENADEVAELVRKCEKDHVALAPVGAARTLSHIRRRPVPIGISATRMNSVLAYEPDDMTVTAQAGMTVGALNCVLASHRQWLPSDPVAPDATSIGALIGAAKAGPFRLSQGTVRDLLIGVRFVGHGGRIVRGGGRVVKNVAGYDLMKVLTGSFGTLGIVVEATFKVRPAPESHAVALGAFAGLHDALAAARAANDGLPLAHLELVSADFGEKFGRRGKFVLAAGFSGSPPELDYQQSKLLALLGEAEIRSGEPARQTYELLRDFDPGAALCAQISVPPAALGRCLEECSTSFLAHAASGVARIFVNEPLTADNAQAIVARWRAVAHGNGGHLRILSALPWLGAQLKFFDRPKDGALRLMRRLKSYFDPAEIFNPGCFVGGI